MTFALPNIKITRNKPKDVIHNITGPCKRRFLSMGKASIEVQMMDR